MNDFMNNAFSLFFPDFFSSSPALNGKYKQLILKVNVHQSLINDSVPVFNIEIFLFPVNYGGEVRFNATWTKDLEDKSSKAYRDTNDEFSKLVCIILEIYYIFLLQI